MHLKAWNKETITDDQIGRIDYPLNELDLSGKPQWYNIKEPDNFSKSAGEIQITMKFEGTGIPEGSRAYKTHHERVDPKGAAPVVSPQPPQQQQQQQQYQQPPPQQQYQQPPPQQQYQQPPPQVMFKHVMNMNYDRK
jgi:hypothetical protein